MQRTRFVAGNGGTAGALAVPAAGARARAPLVDDLKDGFVLVALKCLVPRTTLEPAWARAVYGMDADDGNAGVPVAHRANLKGVGVPSTSSMNISPLVSSDGR